jgi:hypothetical protein
MSEKQAQGKSDAEGKEECGTDERYVLVLFPKEVS